MSSRINMVGGNNERKGRNRKNKGIMTEKRVKFMQKSITKKGNKDA
jgi:hypothetical protein